MKKFDLATFTITLPLGVYLLYVAITTGNVMHWLFCAFSFIMCAMAIKEFTDIKKEQDNGNENL